jgi:hypothetical protein
MATQYTPTLKLALPVTGELSGTWGTVVNDNITSMIEQAIAGLSTINTWTTNSPTLTTANGTTSESRCAILVAATGGGAPTAAAEIICPAAAKLYVVQNTTSYAVTLKTSAGTGVAVAAGNTLFLFCDGTNVNSCVASLPVSTGISGLGTGVATALAANANATGGVTTIDGTATLTNKRITARVNAQTTTTSPWAWNSDSYDQQSFSALANALTINADAGTPTDGQKTIFRFKDNGTARALTWTTGTAKSFRAIGVILPTTTVINKTVYVGCVYNILDSRWDAVAVAQEA